MTKRLFDMLASFLGLVLLSPLFLLLWLLVKLESPGPGFYGARRIGQGKRPFTMYKFRTMVVDADKLGPLVTYSNDPRITRVGTLLRDKRLDELPQLFNVLKGDMSLVGPRPESPDFVAHYSSDHMQLFQVKPGITGPMQIAFLDEEEQIAGMNTLERDYTKSILPAKLAIEMTYIENQSLRYDLLMIFKTIWALLGYQKTQESGIASWNS